MSLSMFFQDYLPKVKASAHLNFTVGTVLPPFRLTGNNRIYRNTYRFLSLPPGGYWFSLQLFDRNKLVNTPTTSCALRAAPGSAWRF